MPKFCHKCGTQASDDQSFFCNKCGTQYIQNIPEKKNDICPNCGIEILYNQSVFCTRCGSPISSNQPLTNQPPPKPNFKTDSTLHKIDKWLYRDAYIDKSKPNFKIASTLIAFGILLLLWSVWIGIMQQTWGGTVENIGWLLFIAGLLVVAYQSLTYSRSRKGKGLE